MKMLYCYSTIEHMQVLEQISLDSRHEIPLALQLKQQLAWLIINGELQPGDRLPAVRQLARQLDINLHTVRSAYQKLEVEGFVETRQGRGSKVLPFDLRRIAQATKGLPSHTIGVILPTITNPFYHSFLLGVEEIAAEDQTLIFLCNTHDDPTAAWRDFARLTAKGVDGVLVISHDVCEFLEQSGKIATSNLDGLPFVTVDWPGCQGYAVQIDLESAGYQGTRHLIEHGHRRIGLLTFEQQLANVGQIEAGYRRALAEAGLLANPGLVAGVPGFDLAAGAEGARRLLALQEPPTALFAIADLLALGAMQFIKATGRQVPGDVALVGFNDIPLAALVVPGLTSVASPTQELGRQAMGMLQDLIAGRQPAHQEIVLPVSLVARQSCGEHDEKTKEAKAGIS